MTSESDKIPSADEVWVARAEQKEFDENSKPTIMQIIQTKTGNILTELQANEILTSLKIYQKIKDRIQVLKQIIYENTPVNSRCGGIEDEIQEHDYLKQILEGEL